MMLPNLSEIKNQRKKISLTQSELARQTGVSQSLIAKIESNVIVPSYSNAKKLFDFFEIIQKEHDAKVSDFMTLKVISVKKDTPLRIAIKTMEKNSISQLPVLDDGKSVGTLSEKTALEVINRAENSKDVLEKSVELVMEDSMPQINEDTPFQLVSSIMGHYSGVLVTKNGEVIGIITKSDLLRAIVGKK